MIQTFFDGNKSRVSNEKEEDMKWWLLKMTIIRKWNMIATSLLLKPTFFSPYFSYLFHKWVKVCEFFSHSVFLLLRNPAWENCTNYENGKISRQKEKRKKKAIDGLQLSSITCGWPQIFKWRTCNMQALHWKWQQISHLLKLKCI